MLQRNSSQQLKRVTLHFHYDKLSQLDHEGLGRIDEVLGGTATDAGRWSSDWREGLKEVEFVLWPNRVVGQDRPSMLKEATHWIEEAMPRSFHNTALKCYDGYTYSTVWEPVPRFAAY